MPPGVESPRSLGGTGSLLPVVLFSDSVSVSVSVSEDLYSSGTATTGAASSVSAETAGSASRDASAFL